MYVRFVDTAVLPDDLTALPPGTGLAAALNDVDPARVPNDRMLEVLRAQYRQLCHEQARMAAVLAELGRCAGYPEPGAVDRLDVPERYAAEEARAALRWTRCAAEREHDLAETVVHTMPLLHAAWLAGAVDRPRVAVFDRFLVGLAPGQVGAICRVAVPRASKLTTGQLAVLLRRMVLAVDPQAAARWYRKSIRERNVVAYIGPDGSVTMSASGLPADEAEAACVRLQDLAAAAKQAGHPGSIGQIRCDLFLGLLDGRFHHLTREQILARLIADYRPDGPGAAGDGVTDPADPARPAASSPAGAPSNARPGSAEPEGAGSEGAEPDRAEPDRAGSDGAGSDGAGSVDDGAGSDGARIR